MKQYFTYVEALQSKELRSQGTLVDAHYTHGTNPEETCACLSAYSLFLTCAHSLFDPLGKKIQRSHTQTYTDTITEPIIQFP